jgi:serine/threonine protein kinase
MAAKAKTSRLKLTAWSFLGLCVLFFCLSWAAGFHGLVQNVLFYLCMIVGLPLLWIDYRRNRSKAAPATETKEQPAASPSTTVRHVPAKKKATEVSAPQLLNKRYAVQKELKPGGMAFIRLAKDTQTGSLCVIKTPRDDTKHDPKFNVEKLQLEAGYLKRFNHPNIVKYIDLFTYLNMLNLVVDYIDGEDLLTAFAAKPAPESRVIKWGTQILSALEYMHLLGVIHRDLNPKNIMLRRSSDDVVIIDFGTGKAPGGEGTRISSPGFEIPELGSRGYADERTDLCGLGGVLFYLLTSIAPGFIGNQDVATLLVDKGVTRPTARCIAQALQLDTNSRFRDAAAMRRALCGQEV